MFLRMIKKDLKDSKGLNVILLLFMIIVSTLASAGGLLQLENTRGISVSQQRCNASDAFIIYAPQAAELDTGPNYLLTFLKRAMPDAELSWQNVIPIDSTNIDFPGKDMSAFQGMTTSYYITAQPTEMDLVYDDSNRPFYVENGCIAVTRQFARSTGVKAGDTFRITTQMGRQYAFTVSVIAKDPTKEWQSNLILSDADYAAILEESPYQRQFVYVQSAALHTDSQSIISEKLYALTRKTNDDTRLRDRIITLCPDCHRFGNNALVSYIVFVFVMIAVVFMLIIILFTLSFSIRSAVKKEERELGIMKALGTDSFSFRWIFAAKYIAFAVIGGAVGCAAGIFAGKYLMENFYYNIVYTLSAVDLLPPLLASVLITVFVILFIFLSLRRIDRISIMDAINGENRSERVAHPAGFQLSLLRKMPVPLYLALAEIFAKLRRYALLLIAFTAGSLLVMYSIQMHDTMISTDFLHKYYTISDTDFGLRYSKAFFDEMSYHTGNGRIIERNINAEFQKHQIPAEVDFGFITNANLCTGQGDCSILMYSGVQSERLHILKGGQPPVLRNEILIDHDTAVRNGYAIGDSVTLQYNKYSKDRLSHQKTKEAFVITGYVDRLSKINSVDVIMGRDFEDAVTDYCDIIGFRIDAPESEKAAYLPQIEALFPDVYIDRMQIGGNFLSMYDILFSFVRNVMIVVVAGVLAFLTVMYQTLFMKDEEHETAMLKSCGFDDGSIKKWQFLRMMLLFGAAQVLAAVLMPTALTAVNNVVVRSLLGLTSWEFTGSWVPCALWIVFITALVAAVELIVLKGIEKTEIWRIRNE